MCYDVVQLTIRRVFSLNFHRMFFEIDNILKLLVRMPSSKVFSVGIGLERIILYCCFRRDKAYVFSLFLGVCCVIVKSNKYLVSFIWIKLCLDFCRIWLVFFCANKIKRIIIDNAFKLTSYSSGFCYKTDCHKSLKFT